jgi:integrase
VATIVRTPAGTWKALVRKQGWPTVIKTFRTKRDADDWSRRTEDAIVRGVYIDRAGSERMMFKAAMDRYLAEVTPTKKASTQRNERLVAEALKVYFGKYSLAAIDTEITSAFRDKRLAEGRRPNTVRLDLALLGHLFTVAIREWRLGLVQNPVANIRKPSPGKGRNRRLVGDEESRLREAVTRHSNPMLGWIFEIALETSMRSSEITGLRLGQVDTARRVVRLQNTKNEDARTVPLTKRAAAELIEAIANPLRPQGCDLIFFGEPGRDGVRRPYNFNKMWRKVKTDLGLSDLRFHDLRHEAVSRLVEAGLSDQEVASISGHKSMQMLRRYTHLRAEDLVARLDGLHRLRTS